MNLNIKREELLISQLANLLKNDNHVAVGAASPIPGAAALLAKEEAKNFNKRLRDSKPLFLQPLSNSKPS